MLLLNEAAVQPVKASGSLGRFERYLSAWVALRMVAGVAIGTLIAAAIASLGGIEFGREARSTHLLRC
jgi:ACR3 family arsenite transporter